MFPKDSFNTPFLQLMMAFEVAKNGLPNWTKTSSTIPLGTLTDLSVNYRVTLVGFNSPIPNCWYTLYGNRLTLAPKSKSVWSTFWLPMMHKMVGQSGSLYLGGVLNCKMELTCSTKNAFSCTFIFLFIVQRSFRNLAYEGVVVSYFLIYEKNVFDEKPIVE